MRRHTYASITRHIPAAISHVFATSWYHDFWYLGALKEDLLHIPEYIYPYLGLACHQI